MKKTVFLLGILSLLVLGFSASYSILSVNVTGNTYTASSTIMNAILLKAGKSYDESVIKTLLLESAKNIMSLGYFSNVTPKVTPGILPNTLNLTFKVWENPIVSKVVIDGVRLVKKSTAEASSVVQTGKPLNINDLRRTIQNIFDLYRKKGYSFSVNINTNVTQTPTGISIPNSVLKIKVEEYAVYDVVFNGDKVTSLSDLKKMVSFKTLKKIQKEPPLWKWLDSLNNNKGYVADQDIITLRYKLMNTGYYSSVDIQKTSVSTSVKGYPYLYDLVFTLKKSNFIKEGEEIKHIVLKGVHLVNKTFLKDDILSKAATKTSIKNVSDLINDIKSFYKDRNYIVIDVKQNYDSHTETLTFNVYERKVRNIDYSGDVILKKNLLDKNLRIHKGEPVKLSSYMATIRNLQMTGYFSDVNIIPTPVSTDDSLVDMTVSLKAKKYLGNFSGGATWGLDQSKINDIWSKTPNKWNAFWQIVWQGIAANIKVQRSNLTGIGDDGSFTFVAGPIKKDISLGYKINWINGSNFSPDVSLFYKNDYDTSSQATSDLKETYGLSLKSNYTVNDFNSVTMGLSLDHYKTYTATSTLKSGMEWSWITGYTFDGRDNPSFPRNGVKVSFNNELKFIDFSQFQYNKTKASFSLFYEPFDNFVLASDLVGGYIYPIDTTDDSFFVGGSNTVRGWGTPDFPSISGTRMIRFNLESRYKMKNGMVLIPAFYDFAHTGGKSISSVGMGIGTIIPMFGTIQLGMVYPLTNDANLNYYIGFGGIF